VQADPSTDAVDGAPVDIYPIDTDSSGDYDGLRIVFSTAPPSGTSNVSVDWKTAIDTTV